MITRPMRPVVVTALLAVTVGACSSGDGDGAADPATEASSPVTAGDEAPQEAPSAADDVSDPPTADASTMTVAVDGESYEFSLERGCVGFGDRFVSGSATRADGAEVSFSYELPDFAVDGDSSEYSNSVSLETPAGNQRWEAAVRTTSAGDETTGAFAWQRDGNLLAGSGTAENVWSSPPETAEIAVSVTC